MATNAPSTQKAKRSTIEVINSTTLSLSGFNIWEERLSFTMAVIAAGTILLGKLTPQVGSLFEAVAAPYFFIYCIIAVIELGQGKGSTWETLLSVGVIAGFYTFYGAGAETLKGTFFSGVTLPWYTLVVALWWTVFNWSGEWQGIGRSFKRVIALIGNRINVRKPAAGTPSNPKPTAARTQSEVPAASSK